MNEIHNTNTHDMFEYNEKNNYEYEYEYFYENMNDIESQLSQSSSQLQMKKSQNCENIIQHEKNDKMTIYRFTKIIVFFGCICFIVSILFIILHP